MSGITIRIGLRDSGAADELEALLRRIGDRRPFFKSVQDRLLKNAQEAFRDERSPEGTPWAALKAATIKARIRKGQVPITKLRANRKNGSSLAGSLSPGYDGDAAWIGSPVPYAAIHQMGGTIDQPARAAKIYRMKDADGTVGRRFERRDKANHVTDVTIPAHRITIPARPYLGIGPNDEAVILDDAEDWLTR